MEITTRDFGKMEIEEEKIINFPQGIPGFVDKKKYVLLPLTEESPFIIIQSVEEPELAFITIDPWHVIADYEIEIKQQVEKMLQITSKEDVLVLVIATIHEDIKDMTVNLAAPVVINTCTRLGKQLILEESNYPLRQSIFPREMRQGVK